MDGSASVRRRYASTLYVTYASVFAVSAGLAMILLPGLAPDRLSWVGVACLGLLAGRLAWVARWGGASLNANEDTLTVRGMLGVARVPRSGIAELDIQSRQGICPRGFLNGVRRTRLAGLSFRHTHRLGGAKGLSCPYCFGDRQGMVDLAAALNVPLVERD